MNGPFAWNRFAERDGRLALKNLQELVSETL